MAMTPYRDRTLTRAAVTRSAAPLGRVIAAVAALVVIGALLAFGATHAWLDDGFFAWTGAGIAWAAALGVLLARAQGAQGEAPCPGCGAKLTDLSRLGQRRGILCEACGRFLRCEDGSVRLEEPDALADEPSFGAAPQATFEWPPGCVVCGEPSVQVLPVILPTTQLGQQEFKLWVPHCLTHDDGVRLQPGANSRVQLVFRSLAYQRAFCELNEARSVDAGEMMK